MFPIQSYDESASIQSLFPAEESMPIPADLDPLLLGPAHRLVERYHELVETLQEAQEPDEEGSRPHYSNHLAEDASDAQEWQSRAAMSHHLSGELRSVEHAYAILQRGQYGQCEQCGHNIPPRRLEIIPSATLCVKCQEFVDARTVGH